MRSVPAPPLTHRAPLGRELARSEDPLALILGHEERWGFTSVCISVAVALHVAFIAFGIAASWLHDMRLAVDANRSRLHDYLWRTYDVEVVKPKDEPPPPPPPPEAPPEPPPVAKAPMAKPVDDPYKDVAPAPAKAAKVLTAEPKPDEPVNFDNTIVSGDGNALGGMQSQAGNGDKVTFSKAASNQGTPGGRGTVAAPPPPPPGPDLTRPVGLAGAASWNCPFPPEADADQIDHAVVGIQVTVQPNGSASAATVVSDPIGHGFARSARQCALAKRYKPALDRTGTAITGTAVVNVTFNR